MTVSLDFIAAQLQRVLEGQARIEQRLTSLESHVAQHRDEMTVLTGMVLHYAGERMAWGAVQNQLRKVSERLEALEQRAT